MVLQLLLFFILNSQQLIYASVSCIGENGHPVDWYIVYKLPELHHSQHHYVGDGLGYVYMDSSSYQFNMPDKSINDTKSAVGHTLQQIYVSYERSGDIAYLMYDDKDPSGRESLSKAHSKGDIAFDSTSGFWLIHSVPGFPPFAKHGYEYPETGRRYGQSFLCVTFKLSAFNDIGLQLLYNGPAIYDNGGPDSLVNQVPNIKKAIDGEHISTEPYYHVTKLSSLDGVMYTSFAKSKDFGSDLYHELVAPYYNASLLVETWQNGEGKLPSNCSVPTVENVEDLRLIDSSFKETEDHSKWAISKLNGTGLVCIGDINRMTAQFKRGGGTLCVGSAKIWRNYRDAITEIQTCPGTRHFDQQSTLI